MPWSRALGYWWQRRLVRDVLLAVIAAVAAGLGATAAASLPISVAAWNQHRKSSYLQKDCIWNTKLQGPAGFDRFSAQAAVEALEVTYSPREVQRWAEDYDAVAIQELDPLLSAALGDELRGRVVRGGDDVDARGTRVASASALLFPPSGGLRELRRASAVLQLRNFKGMTVSRDLLVVLAERPADGSKLILCSVHFHPSSMIEERGGRGAYLAYLEPLKRAIKAVSEAAASPDNEEIRLPTFLLGDFNVHPAGFKDRTASDAFWAQFEPVVAEGGDTAHRSNPSPVGDFALAAGGGKWRGRALGSPDHGAFERHAARVVLRATQRIRMQTNVDACQAAAESHGTLKSSKQALSVARGINFKDAPDTAYRGAVALQEAAATLARAAQLKGHQQQRAKSRPLRRGLLNSDHRPLHYVGWLET